MIETKQGEWIARLAQVERAMSRAGDKRQGRKLVDLMRKTAKGEWIMAFCGHFSAGKSTLLNRLIGEDLLPTSPIPTSANVVKIKAGPDRVTLFLSSGQTHVYKGSYTDQELKELCKNGEEILEVHIERRTDRLPPGVAMLDTPGIDSTDSAHEQATASALHLADVIFYVMDYNHVQSEVNLEFVKRLKQRQKRVYLIVNQIDKHRETELPFSEYKKNVMKTFADWDIAADGFFYTTMRSPDHPENEMGKLQELIARLIASRGEQMEESIRVEAEHLIHEHVKKVKERKRSRMEELAQTVSQVPDPPESLAAKIGDFTRELAGLEKEAEEVRQTFVQGLETILQNAYLMPFEVRELAEKYLETELTLFKVGLLFTKSKTEKEKERRRVVFLEKLKQTVEAELDVHIKQYAVQFFKERDGYTESLGECIYAATVTLDDALLKQTIKPGAGLTGNYVLTYANDLASEIKRKYRLAAEEWWDGAKGLLQEQIGQHMEKLKREINRYEQALAAWKQMKLEEKEQQSHTELLFNLLHGQVTLKPMEVPTTLWQEEEIPVSNERFHSQNTRNRKDPIQEKTMPRQTESVEQMAGEQVWLERMLSHVNDAERWLGQVPGLKRMCRELAEKRKRLEQKQFTVALFGAFSAGKSSFANALIGEKVLPVSPHPTTAAINRICPPDEEHPHGQAIIHFKTAERLFSDLKQIYAIYQKEVTTLEEAVKGIGGVLAEPVMQAAQKMALPFLKAVQSGYGQIKERLGTSVAVDLEQFREVVAREEQACFVEVVDLHYDSPLARQGITVVDTPGADSIHARHTDVAFQYIKNADAIIYVTYYNHPFSKADREFLIQLGRVKDVFALDKMFFIINAADLASTPEELAQVKNYIAGQLLEYGIREPRLFAVSSLQALAAKQQGAGEDFSFGRFEKVFFSFIRRDLALVSLLGLCGSMKQGLLLLRQIIQTAEAGNEAKQQREKALTEERRRLTEKVETVRAKAVEHALKQEVNELLYYVKQRLFFRYHDEFAEFFNPAVLREGEGKIKEKLQACVLDLVDFLKQDLLQELRVTSLRVERWLKERQDAYGATLAEECRKINKELVLNVKVEAAYRTPSYVEPLADLNLTSFKKAMSHFKSAKSFFEKNGKERMKEEMKNVLVEAIDRELETQKREIYAHYLEEWQKVSRQVQEKVRSELEYTYETLLHACMDHVDLVHYRNVLQQLENGISQMEKELETVLK